MTGSAGTQLRGDELFEQQQTRRTAAAPGPAIVAVGLRTPSNQGAIFRIADAVGARELCFVDLEPSLQPRLVRTARGTNTAVSFQSLSLAAFCERSASFAPLIAVELTSASQNLFDTTLPATCSFVVGGERHGIPEPLLQLCERAVHIPMYGFNGSMNVSHALAISVFEWRRQHR